MEQSCCCVSAARRARGWPDTLQCPQSLQQACPHHSHFCATRAAVIRAPCRLPPSCHLHSCAAGTALVRALCGVRTKQQMESRGAPRAHTRVGATCALEHSNLQVIFHAGVLLPHLGPSSTCRNWLLRCQRGRCLPTITAATTRTRSRTFPIAFRYSASCCSLRPNRPRDSMVPSWIQACACSQVMTSRDVIAMLDTHARSKMSLKFVYMHRHGNQNARVVLHYSCFFLLAVSNGTVSDSNTVDSRFVLEETGSGLLPLPQR